MSLLRKFEPAVDRMMKISRVARLAVVAAFVMVLAGGYYAASYRPAEQQVNILRDEVKTLQRKLAKVRVVAEDLLKFEQEINSLQNDLDLALQQLPNRKQFEDLLQDVTTAGKKVGVQIQSIQRAPETERGFYAEVPFKIELEGEFHGIAMFFERVSALPRIVNVGSLTVAILQASREGTVLRVVGDATTFRFLAAPEEPAATADAVPAVSKQPRGRV